MLTRVSLALAALLATTAHAQTSAPKPAALTVQAVPPVPAELAAKTRPYMELRSASFAGWNARRSKSSRAWAVDAAVSDGRHPLEP